MKGMYGWNGDQGALADILALDDHERERLAMAFAYEIDTKAPKMTEEDRAVWDAKAEEEAWQFALEVLEPWVEAARAIGHPELTRVMEAALAEVEGKVDRARSVLETLAEG
jgi:hypothetical protein